MIIQNKNKELYESEVTDINIISDKNISFTELIPIYSCVFVGKTKEGKMVRTTIWLHYPDDFENNKPVIKPELFYKKVWSEFEDE